MKKTNYKSQVINDISETILFYNLAKELEIQKIPFKLISNRESEIYSLFNLIREDFNFIEYKILNKKNISRNVNSADTLVITYWDPLLYILKKINPKILFWNVYPDTLLKSNAIRDNFILHYKNVKLINYLKSNKGLVLMDNSPQAWLLNYKNINFYFFITFTIFN